MKTAFKILLFLFFATPLVGQLDTITYLHPTEKGDVKCIILTEEGFSQLMEMLNPDSDWQNMLSDLEYFSESKFNREYGERRIVDICRAAPVKLPDFLKTTVGKKKDKIQFLKQNFLK